MSTTIHIESTNDFYTECLYHGEMMNVVEREHVCVCVRVQVRAHLSLTRLTATVSAVTSSTYMTSLFHRNIQQQRD